MGLYKSIIHKVIVILGTVGIVFLQTERAQPTSAALRHKPNPMPLIAYLAQLGEEYSHFFTIEVATKEKDVQNEITSRWIQRQTGKRSLQQELEQLRTAIPNFSYEVNKANPSIIHVMDARLTRQKGYALESTIKSIDFTGKVNELPSEIGKHGIPISPPLLMDTRESRDYTTKVHVKGEGLLARDALSNFVPLEDRRSRILWIASTRLGQGKPSYVYYPFPGK